MSINVHAFAAVQNIFTKISSWNLYRKCVNAQISENYWQCEWTKTRWSRDTLSVYFLESLCERGLCEIPI